MTGQPHVEVDQDGHTLTLTITVDVRPFLAALDRLQAGDRCGCGHRRDVHAPVDVTTFADVEPVTEWGECWGDRCSCQGFVGSPHSRAQPAAGEPTNGRCGLVGSSDDGYCPCTRERGHDGGHGCQHGGWQ